MVETVGAVLSVLLDAHVGALANFIEVWSLVTDEGDSRKNFAVAVDEYNAIVVLFERSFVNADVFLIGEKL